MPTNFTTSDAARMALMAGIDHVADIVKITLGPSGKQVVLGVSPCDLVLTQDAATITHHLAASNGTAAGVRMVDDLAMEVLRKVGDGVATAVVILQAMYREGLRHVTAGASPRGVRAGIALATHTALEALASAAVPATARDLARVGATAADGDEEIGAAVAWALDEVGADAPVTIACGDGAATRVELRHGAEIPWGYASERCITDRLRMRCVLRGVRVLLVDRVIASLAELGDVLDETARRGEALLLVAHGVSHEVVSQLCANESLPAAVLRIPEFDDRTEVLADLGTLTMATVVPPGVAPAWADTGTLAEATLTSDRCELVANAATPAREAVARRIQMLQSELRRTQSPRRAEGLRARIVTISGRVALIHADAATDAERAQKRLRVERALAAARAAARSGIVVGGGMALLRASAALDGLPATDDVGYGVAAVRAGLAAPAGTLATNAGAAAPVVLAELQGVAPSVGFDAVTGTVTDLLDRGIVDAAQVAGVALRTAASTAAILLTTEVVITRSELRKEDRRDDDDAHGMRV